MDLLVAAYITGYCIGLCACIVIRLIFAFVR